MAALPAGVQYGLSSESCCEDNKELIYVKLTDSALKAIEGFLNSNGSGLAKPKIQFLPGNEGKISIPAPNSDSGLSGEATFKFSINCNAEFNGGQRSFRCITSDGARRLESCGPLPRIMRVHANEDSYVATEDRMASAVAAEQSKCTRVIEQPHQTDIGRNRRVNVRTAHPYSRFNFDFSHLAERAERAQWPKSSERQSRPERAQWPPVPPPSRASPCAGNRPSSAGGPVSLPAEASSTVRGAAAAASGSLLLNEPPHKKRRISHYRRPSPPSSGYATTSSGERQAADNEDERTNVESLRYLENIERSSWLQTRYPPITSCDIRRAYKDEFDKLHSDYRSLYRRLAPVAALFTRLEVELRSAEPLAYAGVEQRIRDEERRVKNDTSYNQELRCYLHLHSKLAHIKLRVCEYDNKQD